MFDASYLNTLGISWKYWPLWAMVGVALIIKFATDGMPRGRTKRFEKIRGVENARSNALPQVVVGVLMLLMVWIFALYYTNDENFWSAFFSYVALLVLLALGTVVYLAQVKIKYTNFYTYFERGPNKDKMDNFINRYGHQKGKDVWTCRGYGFNEYDLDDFSKHLKSNGLKINIEQLKYVIEVFIKEQGRKIVDESIISKPGFLDKLTGTEFENLLLRLFSSMGYRVQHTGKVGDQGGDLVLNKNGSRILVQAKRYVTSVGNGAVQQAVGAKAHYYCDEAWVVSTGVYTRAAVELADSNKVRLLGRGELKKMMLENLKENWA